jgi:putative acetyltransferase
VLGQTWFYPRFGFSRAKDYGLGNQFNASDTFMVLELQAGVLEGVSGLVQYAPEFRDAE